ncbi:hypothetical protein [Snuella lapsa]|uniref:Uncharacterized protein n=1 Tax=Snuella lapsa TaxID=870481 RepID=A0ABP6YDY4_9FLAO
MRMVSNLAMVQYIVLMCFFGYGCTKNDNGSDIAQSSQETNIKIGFLKTERGDYSAGDQVKLESFIIENLSSTPVSISSVLVSIKDFSLNRVLYELELMTDVEIEVEKTHQVSGRSIFTIPSDFKNEPYGVYIRTIFSDGSAKEFYKTFFRVKDNQTLLTYKIDKEDYNGLSVYKLRGGLSAEYTIQKATASFASAISHTWTTPIESVVSTPDFLERSINYTVDFYNEAVGSTTPIETVIISTGIPGVQYLAKNMKAIVLPLHYLVASGTVKEAQTILDQANNTGYSVYGTIGHDFSITNTQSVGWIKLLELPEQYKKFINDHQVKNVILLGHTGTNDGETAAQKVADTRSKYEAGSLYLMRFSGDASDGYLEQILSDYNRTRLSAVTKVADWEAGIIPEQIDGFSNTLKAETGVTVTSVTASDGVHLWNLGTYTSLALAKKNQAIFEVGGPAVRGISTNQYMLGNPGYESYIRYIPFLYFAGISAEFQYDNWLGTKIKSAINAYFPDIVFENLTFWTNRLDMDVLLRSKGLTVRSSNYQEGQIWNLGNGINSLTEVRADDIINTTTPSAFKSWNESLQYLDVSDLEDISNRFPEIVVTAK